MSSISLCMIVRDEEAMLGDCLASARGVVDDVVVVDTGSRDATKRIAADAGARVFDFPWVDDFAAARNEALRHARGKWVLVLDADERLAPGSAHVVRSTLAGAKFDCGMLRLHEASRLDARLADVISGKDRQADVQLVPRLLRRADGLTYAGAIHEAVTPWLRRRGMKVAGVDVDIVHLGATEAVVRAKSKLERNLRMLRARLDQDPGDLSLRGYLAHDLMRAGDTAEARKVADDGWSRIDPEGKSRGIDIHRLATARGYLLMGSGEYAEARRTMDLARMVEGDNPDFFFMHAYASESEGTRSAGPGRAALLSAARDGYRACGQFAGRVFAQSFVFGATSWAGAARLGIVELLLGNPKAALTAFEEALATRPDDRSARLGRVEAMIDLGASSAALQVLQPLLDDATPDAWTLAALAVGALGLPDDVRLFAGRAQSLLAKGFVASHRRDRLRGIVTSLHAGAVSQG
jgi:glycosyltransferase involved in cell wall biosynthesis